MILSAKDYSYLSESSDSGFVNVGLFKNKTVKDKHGLWLGRAFFPFNLLYVLSYKGNYIEIRYLWQITAVGKHAWEE